MCNSIELVTNFVVRHHGILGCCCCESCGQVGGLYWRSFTFPCDRQHVLRCFFPHYSFASKVTEIGRISVVRRRPGRGSGTPTRVPPLDPTGDFCPPDPLACAVLKFP